MSNQNQLFKTGRAWIELDMDSLRHNVATLRSLLPSGCKLMPVVKADAYGHGAVLISRELNRLGVDAFCVAALQEGVELRRKGIKGDILILGYTSPWEFHQLYQYGLTQTVIDLDYAKLLNAYGKKLKVHIKVDTGMHRLGEWYSHTENIVRIFRFENLAVDGMYTHLCTADDTDKSEYMTLQISRFYDLAEELKKQGISLPKLHIQSSYGIFNCPDLHCDYARAGIALYGVFSNPGDEEKYPVPLRPLLSLRARVEVIKALSSGEALGYGLQSTAQRDMKIATIAIGYGDGISRKLSCGAGSVLIHGKRASIVGRVCMDSLTVDVTDIPDIKQGDMAVIIGKSGKHSISACDIAQQTNTITNEVLCTLGHRLPRIIPEKTGEL